MKLLPLIGVAADADARRLADAGVGQRLDDLVGQGARAADQPDAARAGGSSPG